MLSLNNAHLNVAILDPVADQSRFGTRYCTGGYIYQVTDHRLGDLLSGPTFPYTFNWFDGQGIPDSFRTHLVDADHKEQRAEMGIGIGLISPTDNMVTEFCDWEVTQQKYELRFTTVQTYAHWSFELVRELRLDQRTLRSQTRLKSTGDMPVPIYWFPHPFFPLFPSGECFKCSSTLSMPENAGFELLANGFVAQRDLPWDQRGHFQELEFQKGDAVMIVQKHPKLGLLGATLSYAPAYFPVWGNKNTFSFEPYFAALVLGGSEVSWFVDYDF